MIFNLKDLSFLKQRISDCKIVMLGESDHGAGKAFEIKTELIKYLYYELGFKVLAFESDFYASTNFPDLILSTLFDFWQPQRKSMQGFYSWYEMIKEKDTFHLVGFDTRRSGMLREYYTGNRYSEDLLSHIHDNKIDVEKMKEFQKILNDVLRLEYQSKASQDDQKLFFTVLNNLEIKDSFWRQEVENLGGFALNSWCPNLNQSKFRDTQMASNVVWIKDCLYPNEKIIIWAHNFHIIKNLKEVLGDQEESDCGFLMGEILSRKYGDEIFSIGITGIDGDYSSEAYQGNYDKIKKIDYDLTGCLEESFMKIPDEEIYLDLKDRKMIDNHFKSSALFLNTPQAANWSRVYDGIIYTKKMIGL